MNIAPNLRAEKSLLLLSTTDGVLDDEEVLSVALIIMKNNTNGHKHP